MKLFEKRKLPYVMLAALTLFFCWFFCLRDGVFGSKVDWISQHSVLPEYFRQLFYDTGQLFPEFAANIGGGQNIYHFSYYGLYSPLVLVSYLFPGVEMGTYLIAAMVISLLAAVWLFYYWLRQRGGSFYISFLAAVLFLLAGPMIYHSYNQVMFVNYMPFLCLALLGVDRYFEKRKTGLYTIGVWLMILTSFYFSIGGMLVLVLYGVYRYGEEKAICGERITVKTFLVDGLRFLLPMLTAIFMSAVLLVPTAAALMGGRGGADGVSLLSLFLPQLKILRFVYATYGIGLTTLVITVLIAGLTFRGWYEKILYLGCVLVLTIPFFSWLLNGGLYVRDKVMIPFLPLLCYMIAKYMEKQKRGEISFWAGLVPFLLTMVLLCIGHAQVEGTDYRTMVLLDGIIMVICYLFFYWKRWVSVLLLPSIVFLAVYGAALHKNADMMIEPAFYHKITDARIQKTVEKVMEQEKGFYRMEQSGTAGEDAANLNRVWSMEQYISSLYSSVYQDSYQTFRQEVFQTEQPYRNLLMQAGSKNPVFQEFMGIKYILADTAVPGYEKIAPGVYENKEALPIAYATNQVLSEEVYQKLAFPYQQMALLSYAVVPDEVEKKSPTAEKAGESTVLKQLQRGLRRVELSLEADEIQMQAEGAKEIQTQKGIHIVSPIPKAEEGDVFFLQFQVKNHRPSQDVSVWVEGVRNKLTARKHFYYNENETFTYAIALKEGQTSIKLTFGQGNYEICNLSSYLWHRDARSAQRNRLCQGEFQAEKEETRGNVIKGTIQGKEDGYFITSIPYDENFKVLVDGEKAVCERVNTAFLGVKLPKGEHEISITYHASGLAVGKALSVLGGLLFLLSLAYQSIARRRHKS